MKKMIVYLLMFSLVAGLMPPFASPALAQGEDMPGILEPRSEKDTDNGELPGTPLPSSDEGDTLPDPEQSYEEITPLAVSGDWQYTILNGSYARVDKYLGSEAVVVIPEEFEGYIVQTVAGNAFLGNTIITGVIFPGSLEHIGDYAFRNCKNLTEIVFNTGLVSIGNQVFESCTGLREVNFPNTLTSIGSGAFAGCVGIEYLAFPASLTSIGSVAFQNCTKLTGIEYPIGLETAAGSIFAGCTLLTEITVPEGVASLPAYVFESCTYLQSIHLPSTLKTIGNYAFRGCIGLTGAVTLPGALTDLGSSAFSGCTGLTGMIFPDTVKTLRHSALSGCSGLVELRLPNALTAIENYAFSECSSLTSITLPDTVKSIGYEAFRDCTSLGSINYPTGLTTVSYTNFGIFRGCVSLTEITVPEGVTALPSNMFRGCPYLQTVHLPSSLKTIGSYAFSGSKWLTGVYTLPAGVTSVGSFAFSDCTGLTDIVLPDGLITIGASAFSGCTGFTALTLPDTVETIGNHAFQNCTNLTAVNYPLRLKSVTVSSGVGLFAGCTKLLQIIVPEGVTALPANVFANSTYLQTVILPDTLQSIGNTAFSGCTGLEGVWIGTAVASIGTSAFLACPNLTIHGVASSYANQYAEANGIPFSTQPILVGAYAAMSGRVVLEGSGGLAGVSVHLFDATTGRTTASLDTDENGDWMCDSVVIGNTYEIRYYHQLYSFSANNERALSIEGGVVTPDVTATQVAPAYTDAGAFTYKQLDSQSISITGYTGSDAEVIIPDEMDGFIVTEIDSFAFSDKAEIIRVSLPKKLEFVGYCAFMGSTNLTAVEFGNSITEFGNLAFSGCSGLLRLDLPNTLRIIGGGAFEGCISLPGVVFPDSITTIGSIAFEDCINISSIRYPMGLTTASTNIFKGCVKLVEATIPEGVTVLPELFLNCTSLLTIHLPDSLKTIGDSALRGCIGLTSIDLPDGLTAIGTSAFYGCTGLTSMTLPDSVTSIGSTAFYGTAISSMNYPLGLTVTGSSASGSFSGCAKLTEITVPEGVTALPYNVFSGCASLKTIHLPSTLKTIGGSAFWGCTGLSESFSLPSGVTSIGGYAFRGCTGLNEIILPDGLLDIGPHSFDGCTGLISMTLPDTVTEIGSNAFQDCTKLSKINYPRSLTTTSTGVFSGCVSLLQIYVPEGVTALPNYALGACKYLQTVILPDSLQKIGSGALSHCDALKEVWIGEGVSEIGHSALSDCPSLTIHGVAGSYAQEYAAENDIPFSADFIGVDEYVPMSGRVLLQGGSGLAGVSVHLYDVTKDRTAGICDTDENGVWCSNSVIEGHSYQIRYSHPLYTFSGNNQLFLGAEGEISAVTAMRAYDAYTDAGAFTYTKIGDTAISITGYQGSDSVVIIPEQIDGYPVQTISESAFRRNTVISVVVFPNSLLSIGRIAFESCTNLTEIHVNNGLSGIGVQAFSDCANLFNITLPNTLTTLSGYAFEKCTGLTSIALPDSITTLGNGVFRDCTNLSAINYPRSLSTSGNGLFGACPSLTTITVPEGVKILPFNVFQNCPYLQTVSLPSTLRIIGRSAFQYCTGLTNVEMQEGLTTIEMFAFGGCANLAAINLPNSVTAIGLYAFEDCTQLSSINYPLELKSVGQYAFRNCPNLTAATVPEGVTALAEHAFGGWTSLQTVSLPDTLKSIGSSSFSGCTGLTGSLSLPSGVTYIGSLAFFGCTGLTEIVLPDGLITIGTSAFSGCTGLTSISLPDTVETLRGYAFSDCVNLRSINYPQNLKTAGPSDFANCTNLTQIVVPEGVTVLPENVFNRCTFLRTVVLPSTLQVIQQSAFYGCTGITSLTIPSGVTTIHSLAFNGCSNLQSIFIPPTVSTIANYIFANCPKLTIYGNMDSYATIYAINSNIPYIPVNGGFLDAPTLALDRSGTRYETNYSTMSASGTISMNLQYTIKEAFLSSLSDLKIVVRLPANTVLVNHSLTLNGRTVDNFTNANSVITIPVTPGSGIIRFALKPTQQTNILSYAQLTFMESGSAKSEVIGVISQNMSLLSIEADDVIASDSFKVSGISLPSKLVNFYIDGVSAGSAVASKTGRYSATLSLATPKNHRTYVVKAVSTDAGGNTITAETKVKYLQSAPILTELVMQYDGYRYTMSANAAMPTVMFVDGKPFTFIAKFQNTAGIERVYIISDRNNIHRALEATWDAASQSYIASGFFDPDDHSYVPGIISVQYVETGILHLLGDRTDFTSDYFVNTLPPSLQNADLEVNSGVTEGQITPQSSVDAFDFKLSSEAIPLEMTPQTALANGYMDVRDDSGTQVYVKVLEESGDDVHVQMLDFVKDIQADYHVYMGGEQSVLEGFGISSDNFSLMDRLVIFQNRTVDVNDARNAIINSDRSTAEKQAALERLAFALKLNNDALAVMSLSTVLAASGAALPDWHGTVMSGLLLLSKRELEEVFGDLSGLSSRQSVGISLSFRWAIDPSGYVYEAVTSNRLSGVKATAYFKENESSAAVVWDALEWEQSNPLYTDHNGNYAWDVPEGLWQVTYELDGYETAYSEWLPVPPPQVDVNIGMISLAAPVLEWANIYETYAEVSFDKYMMPATVTASSLRLTDGVGTEISYTLEHSTDETDADGNVFARRFLLRYNSGYTVSTGVTYTVDVTSNAQSYAGVGAAAGSKSGFRKGSAAIEMPSEFLVGYGRTVLLPVQITSFSEADEIVIVCSSSSGDFVEVGAISPIASDGTFTIELTGRLFGVADITVSIKDTSIAATTAVSVALDDGMDVQISAFAAVRTPTGVEVAATLSNLTDSPRHAEVVIAVYEEQGKLIDLMVLPAELDGRQPFRLAESMSFAPEAGKEYQIKIFVIESASTMRPLSSAAKEII